MQQLRKPFLPLVLIFIMLNTFFITSRGFLERKGVNVDILVVANTLIFLVNFIALLLQRKALQNKNPNVFVRSMMAAMMIKMFVVLASLITYIVVYGKTVNKPAIYISVVLYFLYMAVEVIIVMKLNKQKNA